jgi:hypothetical protein
MDSVLVRRIIIFVVLLPILMVVLQGLPLVALGLGLLLILLPSVIWPRIGAVVCASLAVVLAAGMLITHAT